MIEANNLCFSYGKAPLLQGLSFRLEPGRFYGIIGPNGSGKTTLIRLLTRLERPTDGTLSLEGKDYASLKPKELARQVGLLPQGRDLPQLTAGQLVADGRYPHTGLSGRLTDEDRIAIQGAMEQTDTLQFAERPLSTLSGGERQRVYMAMLLAQDPRYLFLDEPTTYLDIGGQLQLMEQLKRLKKKCTVAMLHDLPLALHYCDTLLVLEKGRMMGMGSPKELVSSGLIQRVFGVECCPLPDGHYYIKTKG